MVGSKAEERKRILEYRKRLTTKELLQKSLTIKNKLFDIDEFKEADNIMFYIDFNNEVKTEFMIKEAIDLGTEVIVPITNREEKRLELSKINDFDSQLKEGEYGILEPKEEYITPFSPNDLDLVILPGVAFDEKGNRLGYGGGYYDRLLAGNLKVDKVAISFEIQVIKEVIVDEHDVSVDRIITEKRVIKC